jgi:hypothetical protein
MFKRNKNKSAKKKKDNKPKIKIKVNKSSGTFVKGVSSPLKLPRTQWKARS